MSVQFAGTRSLDDRRRRRLAVAGDAAPGDGGDADAGGVAVLRERLGDIPAASPWLPRSLWSRGLALGAFWLLLGAAALLTLRALPIHPQLEPAVAHLTEGPRPQLSIYVDILLWTLAAQFAGLIGWYRSHSLLDFGGRYRLWAWVAFVLVVWGFFAGTGLHTAVAAVAAPRLRWPIWRGEILVWLAPACLAGLSTWWMVDRDVRRSRISATLWRLSAVLLLAAGAGALFRPELADYAWLDAALLLGHWCGAGLLTTALWWQACYVAYVCADPPEAPQQTWRGRLGALLASLLRLVWPTRTQPAEEKPKPRRRKKAEEGEEDAAPKRRRKSTKTKRTTKPRRAKPVVEEEEEEAVEEEEASDVGDEEWDESSAEAEEASDEADEEWTEEEYEDEEPPPPPPVKPAAPAVSAKATASAPAPKAAPAPPPPTKSAPPAKAEPAWQDDDADDDDDAHYRADGAHENADMFKGLSKRQRRELKKQLREQQRQQGGRG